MRSSLRLCIALSAFMFGACPDINVIETPDDVADTTVDSNAETIADVLSTDSQEDTETVADAPAETVADAPAETVADVPAETVADAPAETVADAPAEVSPACTTNEECDDGNSCTSDECAAGTCTYTTLTGATCDDGSACTLSDACAADGTCAGTAITCDDDNPCTSDGCDPSTGGCVATPVVDGQNCDTPYTCDGVCTAGTCGCECSDAFTLEMKLGDAPTFELTGAVFLNKSGTATTGDNAPLASAGPLHCASDWLTVDNTPIPQLQAYPLDIEWHRACTPADAFSDAANQYAAAGGTYWDALDAGNFKVLSLQVTNDGGTSVASKQLFDTVVLSVTPTFSACTDVQVVKLRANVSLQRSFVFEVESVGSFNAGAVKLNFGGPDFGPYTNPYDWNPAAIPSGGAAGTVTIQSPCGTSGTDAWFGQIELAQWASQGALNTSLAFSGFNGELSRALLFGATIESLGACIDGQRTVVIAASAIEEG